MIQWRHRQSLRDSANARCSSQIRSLMLDLGCSSVRRKGSSSVHYCRSSGVIPHSRWRDLCSNLLLVLPQVAGPRGWSGGSVRCIDQPTVIVALYA